MSESPRKKKTGGARLNQPAGSKRSMDQKKKEKIIMVLMIVLARELNEGECLLQDYYARLLHIARDERAISEGDFFDLMYANPHTEHFNSHRTYAFLRKHKDELILVVANFDSIDKQVAVNIPIHAFDYFRLPALQDVEATELLTGTTIPLTLSPDSPTRLHVPGHSGVIVKITLKGDKHR